MSRSGMHIEDNYLIVVYDVKASRCQLIQKLLSRWLWHVERSVFAGYLNDQQYEALINQLHSEMDEENDQIVIFNIESPNKLKQMYLGTNSEYEHFPIVTDESFKD